MVPSPFRTLLKELRRCDARNPVALCQQLSRARQQLRAAASLVLPAVLRSDSQLPAPRAAGEEPPGPLQVLLQALAVLHRVLPCADGGVVCRDALTGWTANEAEGVARLLSVMCACLAAMRTQLGRSCTPASSTAAASHTSLVCLADSRPCAALAGAMLLHDSCSRPRGPHYRDVAVRAMQSGCVLLNLAASCPPLATALGPDLLRSSMLARTCACLEADMAERPLVSDMLLEDDELVKACCHMMRATPELQASGLAGMALSAPELGSALLAIIRVWGELMPSVALSAVPTAFSTAVWWWYAAAEQSGSLCSADTTDSNSNVATSSAPTPPRRSSQAEPPPHRLPLTAAHVGGMLQVATPRPDLHAWACSLALKLWPLLDAAQQARAYLPVSSFVRSIIDAAARAMASSAGSTTRFCRDECINSAFCLTSVPPSPLTQESCGGSVAGSAACVKDALGATLLAMEALDLLGVCTQPADHDAFLQGPLSSWDGLQSRGRWLLRSGTLTACEGLLRNTGSALSSEATLDLAASVTLLGSIATVQLLDDPYAPSATRALLSILATLRKRLAMFQGGTAAIRDPASDSAHPTKLFCPTDTTAGGRATAGTPAHSSRPGLNPLDVGTGLLCQLLSQSLLEAKCAAGCAAALLVRRCAVLGLLPMAIRTAATQHAGEPHRWKSVPDVLTLVAAANAYGHTDVTAAAGALRLISALLRGENWDSRALCDEAVGKGCGDDSGSHGGSEPCVNAGAVDDGSSCTGGDSGGSTSSTSTPGVTTPVTEDATGGSRAGCGSSSAAGEFTVSQVRCHVLVLSALALVAAGNDPVWVAEVQRLKLPGLLNACVFAMDAAGPGGTSWREDATKGVVDLAHCAPQLTLRVRPNGPAGDIIQAVLDGVARLYTNTAPREAQAHASKEVRGMLSLDACMLATACQDSGNPGGADCRTRSQDVSAESQAFFGCWSRRCINLDGVSEAALQLRKCGGCKLARYCSSACQRHAWRSGHRAACQAWQQANVVQTCTATVQSDGTQQGTLAFGL